MDKTQFVETARLVADIIIRETPEGNGDEFDHQSRLDATAAKVLVDRYLAGNMTAMMPARYLLSAYALLQYGPREWIARDYVQDLCQDLVIYAQKESDIELKPAPKEEKAPEVPTASVPPDSKCPSTPQYPSANKDYSGSIPGVRFGTNKPTKAAKRLDRFIETACVLHDDNSITTGRIYSAYVRWCEKKRYVPTTKSFFTTLMKQRFDAQRRGSSIGGEYTWIGINIAKVPLSISCEESKAS